MTKKNRRTPPEVYEEVAERSGGRCEEVLVWGLNETIRCPNVAEQMSHYYKHRQMGGTTDPFVHSAENIKHLCQRCHDIHDGRRRER